MESDKTLNNIKKRLRTNYPNFDISIFDNAIDYSKLAYKKLNINDPLKISADITHIVCFEMNLDPISIVASILYNILYKDVNIKIEDIKDEFSEEISILVRGIINLSRTKYKSKNEKHAASFRKMIEISTLKDTRVILIKLADRLYKMRILKNLDSEDQIQKAIETKDLYAPIAHRLGLYKIKSELEDLSFKVLNNDEYSKIAKLLDEKKEERENLIIKITNELKILLNSVNIKSEIYGRAKHIFSIAQKMKNNNKEFNELYDLTAFRIILEKKEECYFVLGLIHSKYKAISGRFKDYISLPKSNGYQSLHTAIFNSGKTIEIQIRTKEMHAIAENGIAAHWAYKSKNAGLALSNKILKEQDNINSLKKIVNFWLEGNKTSEKSLNSLSNELKAKEIYVFTPNGDIIILPQGATVLDFAYSIHTELGNQCTGGIINEKIAPIKHVLKSGNIVSIKRSTTQKPKIEWLDFVITSKAKNEINYVINREEKQEAKKFGKAILERELSKIGINLGKSEEEMDLRVRNSKYSGITDIYILLGFGKLTIVDAFKKILPPDHQKLLEQKEEEEKNKFSSLLSRFKKSVSKNRAGVIIGGLDDLLINYAKCCNPIPNEKIIGYISMGKGVTIHRTNCPNVEYFDENRLFKASWASDRISRPIIFQIRTLNKLGLLSDITKILSKMEINIENLATTKDDENSIIEITMTLSIFDVEMLDKIKSRIKNINGVILVNFRRSI